MLETTTFYVGPFGSFFSFLNLSYPRSRAWGPTSPFFLCPCYRCALRLAPSYSKTLQPFWELFRSCHVSSSCVVESSQKARNRVPKVEGGSVVGWVWCTKNCTMMGPNQPKNRLLLYSLIYSMIVLDPVKDQSPLMSVV